MSATKTLKRCDRYFLQTNKMYARKLRLNFSVPMVSVPRESEIDNWFVKVSVRKTEKLLERMVSMLGY